MTLLLPKLKSSSSVGDGKPHPGRQMTEREFVDWVDADTRAEWVDGEVVMMPPVSDEHDDLGGWLRAVLQIFVESNDLGRVKGPEFTVRLGKLRRRRMPDVLFVAKHRLSIIRKNHVEDAPDLTIELVSPESVARDYREKFLEYQRGGVREYWLIDRENRRVELNVLNKAGRYEPVDPDDEQYRSVVVPGFVLKRRWLLGSIRPGVLRAARELGVKS